MLINIYDRATYQNFIFYWKRLFQKRGAAFANIVYYALEITSQDDFIVFCLFLSEKDKYLTNNGIDDIFQYNKEARVSPPTKYKNYLYFYGWKSLFYLFTRSFAEVSTENTILKIKEFSFEID